MQRANKVVLTGALSVLALFGGCKSSPPQNSPEAPSSPAVAESSPVTPSPAATQPSNEDVVYLDQGWSKETREGYYHISQGSTVMPYDIFLNLEVAGGQELFRSNTNSERYGFTPDAADPQTNPDGLPIGLEQDRNYGRPMEGRGCWLDVRGLS